MRGLIATVAVAALALASVASASTPRTSIVIRHQVHGCHAWAVNGAAFKAAQSVKLARGTVAVVTNNDVMPHRLVQVSGPSTKLSAPAMNHMGAQSRIVFAKAGVYKFKTVAGEDYPGMDNMKTIGEDNVLRLTVTVS
jgi:plastocyanin